MRVKEEGGSECGRRKEGDQFVGCKAKNLCGSILGQSSSGQHMGSGSRFPQREGGRSHPL
jgi:hypothetical protein